MFIVVMNQLRTKREMWKRAIRRNNIGKCVACGKSGPLEVDHILPKSRGGSDNIKNLQFLCRTCNARKSAKVTWAKTAGGEII